MQEKAKPKKGDAMSFKNCANLLVGLAVGCAAAWCFIHRNAIKASLNGEPLPEPPAWHPHHNCAK